MGNGCWRACGLCRLCLDWVVVDFLPRQYPLLGVSSLPISCGCAAFSRDVGKGELRACREVYGVAAGPRVNRGRKLPESRLVHSAEGAMERDGELVIEKWKGKGEKERSRGGKEERRAKSNRTTKRSSHGRQRVLGDTKGRKGRSEAGKRTGLRLGGARQQQPKKKAGTGGPVIVLNVNINRITSTGQLQPTAAASRDAVALLVPVFFLFLAALWRWATFFHGRSCT